VGTLPLAQIFGLLESFRFLEKINKEIVKKENELVQYAIKELSLVKNLILYNKQNENNTSIVSFRLKGFHSHDVADYLGKKNIYTRAGNFCCPLFRKRVGVESVLRISFSIFNEKKDIDELKKRLMEITINPELLVFI
jgi:cysteine desulfurase/selenocysteine lyase